MLLTNDEIEQGMHSLKHWTLNTDSSSIQKEWTFDSFRTAMNFFTAVSELAELADHHPAMLSNYTKMRVQLSTHDAKGLTAKDFQLARQIDELLDTRFSGDWK